MNYKEDPYYTDRPYSEIKKASAALKAEMEELIKDENEFHVQDFHPDFDDEEGPEYRELFRSSGEYRVRVFDHKGAEKPKWFEGIGRCNVCGKLQLLQDCDDELNNCVKCDTNFSVLLPRKIYRFWGKEMLKTDEVEEE